MKNIVITGASTGIGRAICLAIAEDDVSLALIGRNEEGLSETKKLIEEKGGKAKVYLADLTTEAEQVGESILKDFDSIYAICNVAGVWHGVDKVYYGPMLWETPSSEIKNVLEVGVIAPVILTKTLLPAMVKNNEGKVLQISGTFENGATGWLHYYIGKKAIEDFTVGLSEELRPYKIQVNTISPSDTWTEAYAKYYPDADPSICNSPEDIAEEAKFLLSDKSDSITGQCIIIRNKNA